MFIIPIVSVDKNHTKLLYHMPWLYHYYIHHSPFIGPIEIIDNFEKLPPLDHGGPEMKCTSFHRNCGKKMVGHMPWISQ